ncbi:adenosine monophosphate-protein transferase [Pyrodictium delaneyi]|uniref:Adenosine monophosphate-protein transferase n=1 Tax=Pyrodictium delaneyi TaxID=1273541 RepID=A0A211YQG3_9CREN|nr:adenosine monophosphate-protein transferase [Pyrodictium delaneyi]
MTYRRHHKIEIVYNGKRYNRVISSIKCIRILNDNSYPIPIRCRVVENDAVRIHVVDVPVPEGVNVIIGQAHFIKTLEDLYEALVTSVPGVKFGIAFCEASQKRLIRHEGNDDELRKLAIEAAKRIAAGHVFVIYIKDAWPINVLNSIKNVQEVVTIFAATANPLQVVVAETKQGRGVLGVIDGYTPVGVETENDIAERRIFLRKIGYKK